MLHINAKIAGMEQKGNAIVLILAVEQAKKLLLSKHTGEEVEIGLDDGRTITPAQRRKAYATLNDIALYTGYTPDAAKEIMKIQHMIRIGGAEMFSLSNCSVTEAREFINTLTDFALREGIALGALGLERTDDIDTYLYQCLKYRKCCICGRTADLHHVDAIGMGNDRTSVDDSMMRKAALCRTHHTIAHQMGWQRFSDQYKIYGIRYMESSGGGIR